MCFRLILIAVVLGLVGCAGERVRDASSAPDHLPGQYKSRVRNQVTTRPTERGCRMQALIPLRRLVLARGQETMAIECQLTVLGEDGRPNRGTLFGSPAAYRNSVYYGDIRVGERGR